MNAHAVLQAGGRGSRLASTETTPKPLRRVGGVPMIERLLRQQIDCGLERFTVITGWGCDAVEAHIRGLQDLNARADIRFVREVQALGNIGGLAQVAVDQAPLLFAFADLVTDMDFGRLLRTHRERGAAITLTSHFETHRLKLGELQVDGDEVKGYMEKPEKRFLICSGIAVFEPHICRLIEPGTALGMADLVGLALAAGHEVTHWLHGAMWMDVNTPEALAHANSVLQTRQDQPT